MFNISSLTASPDQTLSSAEVHSVPAGVLQRGQSDQVDPNRDRVPQDRGHDGAPQDAGLPVGRGPAWSRTLMENDGESGTHHGGRGRGWGGRKSS